MGFTRKHRVGSHPTTPTESRLAAELARVSDLRRAGILTAAEAKAMRSRLLATATRGVAA